MLSLNKENKEVNWKNLMKVAIILICLILIVFGFLLGYVYGDKSCFENPFVYGIEKMNEENNDNFYCNCISESGKLNPFSFDEKGIKINNEIDFLID